MTILSLVVLSITTVGAVGQQKLYEKEITKKFQELLPGMGAKDQRARRNPQQTWQKICYQVGAPGNEKYRLQVCKLMCDHLGPKTPTPARMWLLKQLQFIGRGESVNAVAEIIDDKNERVRDAAIRCLANNPDSKASGKLVGQLKQAKSSAKVALLHALGYRKDSSTIPSLVRELKSKDASIQKAAARALSLIATKDAGRALADARKNSRDAARLWICDAYLNCADQMVRKGNAKDALEIYKTLSSEKLRPVRFAAIRGRILAAREDAGEQIFDLLQGKDSDARNIALSQILSVNSKALKGLTSRVQKLPEDRQIRVLRVLAQRREKSLMPIALAAAKSNQEELQKAGLLALGHLGDASIVPMLIELTLSDSKAANAAKTSLATVTGKGVNEKIIASARKQKDPDKRRRLIQVIEQRRIASALPFLVDESDSKDANLRASAISALRVIAEPKDLPAIIPALVKAENQREREHCERTLLAVCKRIPEPEKRAEAILKAVNAENKAALLPLLGSMGGEKTLEMARDAVNSKRTELYEAGMQALCNWPNPTVSEDLIQLVKAAKKPSHRALALKSLIRVNSVKSSHSEESKLANLKKAMKLAGTTKEKQMVLGGLEEVRHIEALRYVLPYLKKKELTQAACRTIVELAHSRNLRRPNQKEFIRALDQVLKLCRNQRLIDRAKKYREDF